MSSENDTQIINGLFDRLEQTEQKTGPRDSNAYQLISQRVEKQPAAPYYMAQTILIQEAALKRLTERVEALEQQVRAQQQNQQPSSGGFLSGLFGGGRQQSAPQARPQAQPGWGAQTAQPQMQAAPSAGRSFLTGALQTATGVAGGMVLGNMLTDMFEGHRGEDIVNNDASNFSNAGYDQGYDQGLQDGSYDAGYDDAMQQNDAGFDSSQDYGGGNDGFSDGGDFGNDDYF